tara:strand:+ start:1563 stop:2213 length:651 start_codon:yes stop_codon:yes gene_type:complete
MTEKNKDVSKFYNNLHKSYITLRDNIEDFIEQQIDKINGVNNELTQEIEQYKSEVDNLRKVSIVSNLNKQIDDLTKKNEQLSKKNCKQYNTITHLNIELEKLREELENRSQEETDDDNHEDDNNEDDNNEDDKNEDDKQEDDDEIYEVEINDITYNLNNNDEILDDNTYDVIGKLINDIPYIYLDCCYTTNGAIYERKNVNTKIGKLSKKYLFKIN